MYVSESIQILQIIILGYALGSIPFGVLLAKIFRLPDPRYIGSGNIGATNMLRAGNKKVALLTLILDAAKGAAAVLITRHLFRTPIVAGCIGDCPAFIYNYGYESLAILCAAVGHMYSPVLKFKGGKGVATLFGGALALSWPVGMAGLFVWLIVMFVTSYVSLASIITLAITPFIVWLRVDGISAFILAIASAIAIYKHRENIKRLRKGFEPKTQFTKGDQV
jgi:glycerol-3-phosphate acyltransferase PlsY